MIALFPFIGEARQSLPNKVQAISQTIALSRMGAQLSQKSMAIDMGLDEAHLSQQLNLHGVNLARLLLLPKRFWVEFLPKLAVLADCAELLIVPSNPLEDIARLKRDVQALQRQFGTERKQA